jgi:hypothetical protein
MSLDDRQIRLLQLTSDANGEILIYDFDEAPPGRYSYVLSVELQRSRLRPLRERPWGGIGSYPTECVSNPAVSYAVSRQYLRLDLHQSDD